MTARIKQMHKLFNRSDTIEQLLKNAERSAGEQAQRLNKQATIKTEKMALSDAMNDNEWLEFLLGLAKT